MSNLPRRNAVEIEFSDLTYCVQNGANTGYKTILRGASGVFQSGKLSAIMGPSGAGKSTLMNILAGYRTTRVSGEININGKPRLLKNFRKQSCYIMQDDHLLPFLTVQEYIDGAAALKLGSDYTKLQKKTLVQEILQTLKLTDSCNTRVQNLSGGEKKRLSIASELINNPPVMFFDEPTSGLDSQNSYYCVNLLKSLAEGGRTIICTIHQPSAKLFEMFDYLYALAEGQCIYRGPVPQLIPFMSSLALVCPSYHNPADFLVEVASGEYGNYIDKLVSATNSDKFIEENGNKTISKPGIALDLVTSSNISEDDECKLFLGDGLNGLPIEFSESSEAMSTKRKQLDRCNAEHSDYPVSYWTQFWVLLKRNFKSIIRDSFLTKLRFISHLVVAVFIGILYYGIGNEAGKALNNSSCLSFGTLFLVFSSMMPTILTFPLEMNVFIREHLNHWYSLKPYYLAKAMADFPFQIIFPLMYVLIVYFMTDQPLDAGRFLLYTGFSVMTSLVAQSIGLAIGAAMEMQQAVFFGPTVTIPAMLFSGFFVTYSTIPVYLRWLTYLSYIRYGYEGSLLSIYSGDREPLKCSIAFCMFKHPQKLLEELDMKDSSMELDMILLIIYFLIMRAVGYFILRWKIRKER